MNIKCIKPLIKYSTQNHIQNKFALRYFTIKKKM